MPQKSNHADNEQQDQRSEKVRIDAWLWATRFFKTRSLAHTAVEGGKIYLNQSRVKPGRAVAIGDQISIQSPRGVFEVVVTGLCTKRVSASLAATMFSETEQSKLRREQLSEMHRLSQSTAPSEKPNSQDRQLLRRIKEGY
jgi:ribosome-associated heat shock protein Hsp15